MSRLRCFIPWQRGRGRHKTPFTLWNSRHYSGPMEEGIEAMTTELFYLMLTTLLSGVLWIPYVTGLVLTRGFLKPSDYRAASTSALPDWVNRANRAHQNAVENYALFAVVVLVAHVLDITSEATRTAAAVYFFARLAHAVVHVTGFPYAMARTIIFAVGWGAFVTMAVEILRTGP